MLCQLWDFDLKAESIQGEKNTRTHYLSLKSLDEVYSYSLLKNDPVSQEFLVKLKSGDWFNNVDVRNRRQLLKAIHSPSHHGVSKKLQTAKLRKVTWPALVSDC
jgi:hypothetical protein